MKTVGNHIHKKRLDSKLSRPKLAKRLGVSTTSIYHWEVGYTSPEVKIYPSVIKFLGYDPLFDSRDLISSKIENFRRKRGLTYTELAERIGISEQSLLDICKEKRTSFESTIQKILNVIEASN